MDNLALKPKLFRIASKIALRLGLWPESNPLLYPLSGDTCIQYAFAISNLLRLNKNNYQTVLEVGCCRSSLTPIMKELGFTVCGIDLMPSPLSYKGVKYIQGDFLTLNFKDSYDIIVMVYVLEHVGLKGRYDSTEVEDGDIIALEKVKQILNPGGVLIFTIPYGVEKTVKPLHRVYNRNSRLLKYAYENFEVQAEEFYKNNSKNIWVKCEESEARKVMPSENNYALGLFTFGNKVT